MRPFARKLLLSALLAPLAVGVSFEASGAGPSKVAKANQSLWPSPLTSQKEFDAASRAEILVFVRAYRTRFDSEITPDSLGIKKVNSESVSKWKAAAQSYWLNAYLDASKTCADDKDLGCGFKGTTWENLVAFADKSVEALPPNYRPWLEMSRDFYAQYLNELVRLAALFPNPTSEALPLEASEIFGNRYVDREFLLTFDDGPKGAKGDTDRYADLLRGNGVSATFFVLGQALEKRKIATSVDALKALYRDQCLASHGYEHKSHQKWTEWRESLDKTSRLIKEVVPDKRVTFRPPFGQRTAEVVAHVARDQAAPVVLWNIDSQDWHSGIKADELGDRVQKLMLVWRKGIILFHDIHPKALTALPRLFDLAKKTGLKWVDCRTVQ